MNFETQPPIPHAKNGCPVKSTMLFQSEAVWEE